MTVPNPARERLYPLAAPVSDRRFSFGLTIDIASVLAEHGYPLITSGGDLVALQQALFGFLYAPIPHDDDSTGFGYSEPIREPEQVDVPADITTQPFPLRGQDCDGAAAGIDAKCGQPGPHAPHRVNW